MLRAAGRASSPIFFRVSSASIRSAGCLPFNAATIGLSGSAGLGSSFGGTGGSSFRGAGAGGSSFLGSSFLTGGGSSFGRDGGGGGGGSGLGAGVGLGGSSC